MFFSRKGDFAGGLFTSVHIAEFKRVSLDKRREDISLLAL